MACCETDMAPDVSVDFEALPRGLHEAVAVSETADTGIAMDEAEV